MNFFFNWFHNAILLLSRYLDIVVLVGYACLAVGSYLENWDLIIFSGSVMMLSLPILFLEFRGDRAKNDSFASNFRARLNGGEYFNSSCWQKAYSKYRSRYLHHHLPAGSIMTDLSIRCLKICFRRNLLWLIWLMGFAMVAPLMFCELEHLDPDIRFAPLAGCIGIVVSFFIYTLFIYIFARMKCKLWLELCEEWEIDQRSVESSYLEGTAFECNYNCVVIGNRYVHGFDGEYFFTVPRNQIREVSWFVERIMIFGRRRANPRSRTKIYKGDEYRFYIVFSCIDGEKYKIALDQFQIKLIMDIFFAAETVKPARISYSETSVDTPAFISLKKYTSPVLMNSAEDKPAHWGDSMV
jgi:hypothetical protein